MSEQSLKLRMPVRSPEPGWIRVERDHALFQQLVGSQAVRAAMEQVEGGSGHVLLAEKRRRAERRLEEKRLRDELGYYDLELDDF